MPKLNKFFLFVSLLFTVSGMALPFGPSPYERLRYNSRFCKADLNRVVSALSKSHTHKGCLIAALKNLKDPKAKLYRQFDYVMPGSKEISDKNLLLRQRHRAETRDILINVIEKRLNLTASREKNPLFLNLTDYGKVQLEEDMGTFCAHMGDFSLLPGNIKWDLDHKPDFNLKNAHLVMTKLNSIDLYELINEYQRLLNALENLKKIDPKVKKDMVNRIKNIRGSLLFILDNLVILKKRASLKKYIGETKDELNKERTRSANTLVNLRASFDHVKIINDVLNLFFYGKNDKITEHYPQLFNLYVFISHLNDMSNKCLGLHKEPSGK